MGRQRHPCCLGAYSLPHSHLKLLQNRKRYAGSKCKVVKLGRARRIPFGLQGDGGPPSSPTHFQKCFKHEHRWGEKKGVINVGMQDVCILQGTSLRLVFYFTELLHTSEEMAHLKANGPLFYILMCVWGIKTGRHWQSENAGLCLTPSSARLSGKRSIGTSASRTGVCRRTEGEKRKASKMTSGIINQKTPIV